MKAPAQRTTLTYTFTLPIPYPGFESAKECQAELMFWGKSGERVKQYVTIVSNM